MIFAVFDVFAVNMCINYSLYIYFQSMTKAVVAFPVILWLDFLACADTAAAVLHKSSVSCRRREFYLFVHCCLFAQ